VTGVAFSKVMQKTAFFFLRTERRLKINWDIGGGKEIKGDKK
jgi:hypothetical protein